VTTRTSQKNGYKVLVVDDDPAARAAVSVGLRRDGFLTAEAGEAGRARLVITKNRPDLVILDLGLPDADGLDLLRDIRADDDIPIIVCSARAEELDRIIGLELGADDYVTKPFSPRELASRAKTVLRRSKVTAAPVAPPLSFGPISIDPDAREVYRDGALVVTTAKEFDLLLHLAQAPRAIFSRLDLLREVWNSAPEWQSEATVTEHVRRLRLKIEEDATSPKYLTTVRGVGYRLMI
jgi:DNA-binding response OmpR family regulator